jgi:hypothetical protein
VGETKPGGRETCRDLKSALRALYLSTAFSSLPNLVLYTDHGSSLAEVCIEAVVFPDPVP